jgi:hypothetical protein
MLFFYVPDLGSDLVVESPQGSWINDFNPSDCI